MKGSIDFATASNTPAAPSAALSELTGPLTRQSMAH